MLVCYVLGGLGLRLVVRRPGYRDRGGGGRTWEGGVGGAHVILNAGFVFLKIAECGLRKVLGGGVESFGGSVLRVKSSGTLLWTKTLTGVVPVILRCLEDFRST